MERVGQPAYDAAGNMMNDGTHSYTYDAENRITSVDGGPTGTYVYGASGIRVRKTSSAGTFDDLYDLGGHILTELNSSGGWTRTEIYAAGRHIGFYTSSSTVFAHTDWLGTERSRTSQTGAINNNFTSLAFGDGLSAIGASPLHFTGQARDAETGLDEFPARYYSSTQGRWLSPDWSPIPVAIPYANLADPRTLNLYAYVGNDPTNHADPDGHTNPNPPASANSCGGAGGPDVVCTTPSPPEAKQVETGAQNQSQQQTQQTQQQPTKGGGVLPTGAAAIDLGVGKAGATVQGSAAVGAFVDNKGHPHVGAEASGSVDAYAGQHTAAKPQQEKDSFVLGAFAGVGGGLTFTNAGNAPAMKTMTNTLNIDLGIGPAASISVSSGHSGVTSFTITFGWGYGAAVTETNTSTVTAPSQ